jgi:hypothetical protein
MGRGVRPLRLVTTVPFLDRRALYARMLDSNQKGKSMRPYGRMVAALTIFVGLGCAFAFGQEVGPGAGGSVGPNGVVSPGQGPGSSHDLPARPSTLNPSNVELQQCQNFLDGWPNLLESRKAEMQSIKIACDEAVAKATSSK